MEQPNVLRWLLRSRKVFVALITLLAVALAEYTQLSLDMQRSIIAVGLALMGTIAWEDSAEKSRPTTIAAGGDATVTNTVEKRADE